MATAKNTTKKEHEDGFAVIATGGKQYVVTVGQTITIEKIKGEHKKGDSISFGEVLLSDDGKDTKLGAPFIDKAAVAGEIVSIGRAPKVMVIKYKQKSRYFKKNGHKQPQMKIKITSLA